jgi:hypothetical protein
MLEKTDGIIKNGQSRYTGNIGHTRYRTKTKHKSTTQHVRFVFTPMLYCREFMMYQCLYLFTCPIWFLCQMILVSFNINKTGVISGSWTADPSGVPKFTTVFSGVRVVINRSLFIPLSFLFSLLYCLSLDLRLPVTLMVHVYLQAFLLSKYVL